MSANVLGANALGVDARSALPAAPRRDPRRTLRALARPIPGRRPRLLYGVIAVCGAVAIGAAQMGLSILTTQTSYEISSLTKDQSALTWQKQILQDDVAGLSSPQFLAANAAALGMVINESPNYLRLSDGSIVGSSAEASGASSVDALSRAAVGNALVSGVPLVTDPDATLATGITVDDLLTAADPATPPPIAEGLPTPATH